VLVCNWLHSVGQNQFFVMMFLNRYSAIQNVSRRFCTVYKSEKSDPLQPSGRRDIPSGRPIVQSIIRPDDENFPSEPPSVSRIFELLQLASVRTFQQHIRTTLSVRPAMGFPSKIQIWEDRCNRPNNVDYHPDELIHKASIAFKIQTSGHQSSWSRRASIIYGNCVRQINRLNNHSLGPDTWSLDMKIGCSGSATVRTTGQHRPDAAQIRKEFQQNFGKPIAQLSVRTPYDYRPDGA
jgi:hypothetical protein